MNTILQLFRYSSSSSFFYYTDNCSIYSYSIHHLYHCAMDCVAWLYHCTVPHHKNYTFSNVKHNIILTMLTLLLDWQQQPPNVHLADISCSLVKSSLTIDCILDMCHTTWPLFPRYTSYNSSIDLFYLIVTQNPEVY